MSLSTQSSFLPLAQPASRSIVQQSLVIALHRCERHETERVGRWVVGHEVVLDELCHVCQEIRDKQASIDGTGATAVEFDDVRETVLPVKSRRMPERRIVSRRGRRRVQMEEEEKTDPFPSTNARK